MAKLDKTGLPFAPINKPSDLFDDLHLNESGGLLDLTLPNGEKTRLPGLPVNMAGRRFGVRQDLPKEGEHSADALKQAGLSDEEIKALYAENIVQTR